MFYKIPKQTNYFELLYNNFVFVKILRFLNVYLFKDLGTNIQVFMCMTLNLNELTFGLQNKRFLSIGRRKIKGEL